eukprot:m.269345 g.269345  ORF g.269345 m.269345 type:complete len:56 (-) comp54736_c0_seq1:192-359(-)
MQSHLLLPSDSDTASRFHAAHLVVTADSRLSQHAYILVRLRSPKRFPRGESPRSL